MGFGDRMGLVGPYRAGKSTRLRLVANEFASSRGRLRLGAEIVVGRYAREQETVDSAGAVLDQPRASSPLSSIDARSFLHRFLVGGAGVFPPAGQLPSGEPGPCWSFAARIVCVVSSRLIASAYPE